MERDIPSPEAVVGVPKMEPSHEIRGKHSHRLRRPTQTEGLHTVGCGPAPKGDSQRHSNQYPSAMQPSARLPSTLAWVDRSPVSQHVL